MTFDEAMELKPGNLVYLSGRCLKTYKGMVFEVADLYHKETTCGNGHTYVSPEPTIVLKQAGYDLGWRHDVQYQMIKRYEG